MPTRKQQALQFKNRLGTPSLVSEPEGPAVGSSMDEAVERFSKLKNPDPILDDADDIEDDDEEAAASGEQRRRDRDEDRHRKDIDFLYHQSLQKFNKVEDRLGSLESRMNKIERGIQFLIDESKGKRVTHEDSNINEGSDGRYKIPPRRNSNSESISKFPLPRNAKFKISNFTGAEDVIVWIQRLTHHFITHEIDEDIKVPLAVYYLDGKAMTWWQWMLRRGINNPSWVDFSKAIRQRFGRKPLEDPMEQLNLLRQTSTIEAYHEEFTSLSNEVENLPDSIMLSCYLSGLKDSIRLRVKAGRPRTVMVAFELALTREQILEADRREFKGKSTQFLNKNGGFNNAGSKEWSHKGNEGVKEFQKQQQPYSSKSAAGSDKGRITQNWPREKVKAYIQKNLCYYCDQPYSRGHTCSGRKLYSMVLSQSDDEAEESEEEELSEEQEDSPQVTTQSDLTNPSISLNALTGSSGPNTIIIKGSINKKEFCALLDTGSTHNFIDPKVVRRAGLTVSTDRLFDVTVAGGEKLQSSGYCPAVLFKCQGKSILADYYVLPIGSQQIVLGAQWMSTLNGVWFNFSEQVVKFQLNGSDCELHGVQRENLTLVGADKMHKSIYQASASYLLQISMVHNNQVEHKLSDFEEKVENEVSHVTLCSETVKMQYEANFEQLLQEFQFVFTEPTTLLPNATVITEYY